MSAMKRSFRLAGLTAAAVGFSAGIARAQTADDSVRAVVRQALDQIVNRDTSGTSRIFTPTAALALVSYSGDSTLFRVIPVRAIVASLVAPGPRRREELLAPRVTIESGLATLTSPYRFYADDALHHCGVAMYDLVRLREGWRIASIRETDVRVGCSP